MNLMQKHILEQKWKLEKSTILEGCTKTKILGGKYLKFQQSWGKTSKHRNFWYNFTYFF